MTALPTDHPPVAERSWIRRARWPLLSGAGVLAATVALRLRDPHVSGAWGLCPLRTITGLDCPMCGGLRAVNDLTHGDVLAAGASNLLFVASIPLIVALYGYWLWRTSRTTPPRPLVSGPTAMRLATAYGVVAVLFTVWRNTPWGSAFWA